MAMNVTSLGMSYLDPMQLPEMLKKLEGYVALPYDDGLHLATVGIGIALRTPGGGVHTGNLALVLRKIGVFTASADYQSIVNHFAQIIRSHSLSRQPNEAPGTSDSEEALQNALNAAVAQYVTDQANPTFGLSLDHAKEVKMEYILGYNIGPYSSRGAQAELDDILAGVLAPADQPVPHDTREYKALMSLYFNGPSLVGPRSKLREALAAGDRAEAWFEIRYNSNSDALDSTPSNVAKGIAKRRYYESELFGLYGDPSQMTAAQRTEEAKEVYRMFTRHREEIALYESRYGIAFDGSLGTQRVGNPAVPPLLAANADYALTGADAVDAIHVALVPARDLLLADLRVQYPSLNTVDLSDAAGYLPTNILLDANDGTVLNARNVDQFNVETPENNILIGEGGDDTLVGGKGDDILIGGEGWTPTSGRVATGMIASSIPTSAGAS